MAELSNQVGGTEHKKEISTMDWKILVLISYGSVGVASTKAAAASSLVARRASIQDFERRMKIIWPITYNFYFIFYSDFELWGDNRGK
jgi:hypothetical protein